MPKPEEKKAATNAERLNLFSSNLDEYQPFEHFQSLAEEELKEKNSADSNSFNGDVVVAGAYSDDSEQNKDK